MIKKFITLVALIFTLTTVTFSQRVVVSTANHFRGDSASIGTITKGSYSIPANGVWDWKKGDNVLLSISSSSMTVSFTNAAIGKEKTLTISATSTVSTLSWPSTIGNVTDLPTSFAIGRIEVWKFIYAQDGLIYASRLVSAVGADVAPPAAITNLVVNNATTSGATFNFTAPTDNSGAAASYDVRVSTQPIADSVAGGTGAPPTYVGYGSALANARSIDSVRVGVDCGTGNQRAVFAMIGWFDYVGRTITGVYNRTTGTSLTRVGGTEYMAESMNLDLWYGVAPAAGVNYITVKFSGTMTDPIMAVSAWQNIDQTTPVGAYNTTYNTDATSPSNTLSSSSTKMVIDGIIANVNAGDASESVGPLQTLITQISSYGLSGDSWLANSYLAGASSVTMTHTLTPGRPWISLIAELNGTATSDTVLWSNATSLVGEPVPQAAGSTEAFVLNGLSQTTTYYARVKSADASNNISALSNQVTFTTANGGTSPGSLSSTYWGFPGGPSITGGSTGYYLDSAAASDAGNGKTPATAKKTWAAIQALLGTEAGYDTVWIRKGTYTQNMVFDRGGTASQPLVVMRYGSEEVIFDGANDNLVPVVNVNYQSYIVIQGIKFRDGEWTERRFKDTNNDNTLVLLQTGTGVIFRWNYVVSTADSAEIMFGGTAGVGGYYHPRGVAVDGPFQVVEHCYIRGWDMGIVFGGNAGPGGLNQIARYDTVNFVLASNIVSTPNSVSTNLNPIYRLIEYCRLDTTWQEDNIQTEDYFGATAPPNPENHKNIIIRYNTMGFSGENCVDLKGSADVFLYGNTFWQSFGDDNGPWWDGITGSTGPGIETGWDNPATGRYPASRHVVFCYNIVSDARGGVKDIKDWQVFNNTILNNRRNPNGPNQASDTSPGIEAYGTTNYPKVYLNNILANNNPELWAFFEWSGKEIFLNGNVYYDTLTASNFYVSGAHTLVGNFAAWQTWFTNPATNSPYGNVIGKDANSYSTRPVFASNTTLPVGKQGETYDFTPVTGSFLLGAGFAVTYATNSGASSTTLIVNNASVFHGAWSGVTEGQLIYIGSDIVGKRAKIISVDWNTNTIILDTPLTWVSSDPVHLSGMPSYNGRPNIGAK